MSNKINIVYPKIYLVGHQLVNQIEMDTFLRDHNVASWETDTEVGAEELVEAAGRVCYMSFAKPRPGGNKAYIDHIIKVGHGSVLEHAVWNFIITGVSRSFTHELVRHRAGFGYSQLSQRYVDESVAEYVEPEIISNDEECHKLWLEAVSAAHEVYMKLSERLATIVKTDPKYAALLSTDQRKAARQAARSVLPNATETKIFVTANARAIRHFIEMRGNPAAEPEIRSIAVELTQIMKKACPAIFGDYQFDSAEDGELCVYTEHRKV